MEKLEKVEAICEKAGVSYEDAKIALENNDWDMLDAMIELERAGKIIEKNMSSYSTKSNVLVGEVTEEVQTENKGEKKMKKFFDWCVDLFNKANRNSLEIEKDGKMILTVPVSIFVVLLVFCFWAIVPLMIVGLFFSMHYHFSGPDIHNVDVDINAAMETASKTAETIKSEFTKDKDNQE